MSKKTYTAIPDTSDADYWELKSEDGRARSKTFVPRDKELHLELKTQAWKKIQAALPGKLRKTLR